MQRRFVHNAAKRADLTATRAGSRVLIHGSLPPAQTRPDLLDGRSGPISGDEHQQAVANPHGAIAGRDGTCYE